MNKTHIYRLYILTAILMVLGSFCPHPVNKQKAEAAVEIQFHNTVSGAPIVLYDSLYTNPFGEEYSINKFRYYISHLSLSNSKGESVKDSGFYLIDEKIPSSQTIRLSLPAGKYRAIHFLLGVDSLHNVSGAQSGALDPAKDMFWTWNTGYVMAKLEGQSPASTIVNRKYEYHIGGFAGKYNVLKKIELALGNEPAVFENGSVTVIKIQANVDAWWRGANDIKIAERPAINSPGNWAVMMSDNYAKMFSIKEIETNQ